MEFYVSAYGPGAHRPLDCEYDLPGRVFDGVAGFADGPVLLDGPNDGPGRRGHLHALQPARTPAGVARQRSIQVDHLERYRTAVSHNTETLTRLGMIGNPLI